MTLPKPYYEREGVVLYHADCLTILPELAAGSVDAVVTDPPYGIEHETNHGASWERTQIAGDSNTAVRDFVIAWCDGRIPWACFGTWKIGTPASARGVLVWDKGPAFGMGDLSFPWKASWEEIAIGGPGWTGYRDEGVIRGHLVVTWESKGRVHPHQKPVSLIRHLLGKLPMALTICDPTAGSGTTGVACIQTGRRFCGIEIEESYCDIAAKRMEKAAKEVESEAKFFGSSVPVPDKDIEQRDCFT